MYADLGADCTIQEPAKVGVQYRQGCQKARLGARCVVRAFTTIYADVEMGDYVSMGHYVLIREHTCIGSHVVIGTGTIIDGYVRIGDCVKIEGNVYIPTHTIVGNRVFVGPNAVLTNDKHPLRRRSEYDPKGPTLEDDVSVGANATILPGVRIGAGSIVGAGAVVTADVPQWHFAVGVPARFSPLPEHLREENRAKRW
jgi:acetyltransferase-like isoleucine patch superfamily enzyme